MSASASYPNTLVFESNHEGSRVEVFADRQGLRIRTGNQELLMVDWERWFLINVYSGFDVSDARAYTRMVNDFWAACIRAIPPPPEDDDDR